jgi:hypothetical protein
MKTRVAATTIFALLLGAEFYSDQKGLAYDFRRFPWTVSIVLILTPIALGAFVERWWVFAALLGPVAALGYLQLTGYISPEHDGEPPLGIPSWAAMVEIGLILLLGVGLRRGWGFLSGRSRLP